MVKFIMSIIVKSFHLNTAELRDPVFYIYIKNKLCILKAHLLSPNIFWILQWLLLCIYLPFLKAANESIMKTISFWRSLHQNYQGMNLLLFVYIPK